MTAFAQVVFNDDFSSYRAESDAAPNWQIQEVGWTVVSGSYEGQSSYSAWRAVPYASALTFACDLTVLEQGKGDWLTAGIAIMADGKNYWGLNLSASPESMQRRHFVEMHESLDGNWLAEGQAGSRLAGLPSNGQSFNWQTGQTYRMEISLTTSNIIGRVLQKSEEVARFGHKFNPAIKAVNVGRPAVRATGLHARFDNATVAVHQTAPEPVEAKPVYPAWTSREGKALVKGTGFFRTAEADGRWWLVDPEGKPFFDVGTDHVSYRGHFCEKLGYSPYNRNVKAKYGSETNWAEVALKRLSEWGFNTLPAGHSASLRHHGMPHILFASFGSGFARREYICEPIHWTGFPDVFSPRWDSHCRLVARRMAQESINDPWCLGTFLDNELEWYGKKGQLVDEVFRGSAKPGKKTLYGWLVKRFGSLDAVNQKLNTRYADEAAFLATTNLPPASPALSLVRDDFLALIAERYFSVAAGAMRAADPQHMVLGCRFAGRTPEPVLAAAGKYNDVFTFNTYPRVDFENAWLPDGTGATIEGAVKQIRSYYDVVKKPVIITEWGFPALDSGLPCLHGAGMRVDTQEQKAACYRIFANTMADLPFIVGQHFFMWADEPALGISSGFPEDSNYGLVNEQDVPYETLVKVATDVNKRAATRHAASQPSGYLQLTAERDAAVLRNTNAIPSHGSVRITAAGQDRIEAISLKPGEKRRLAMSSRTPWIAELLNWDTTKTRVSGEEPATTAAPMPASALQPTERVEYKSATTTWSCTRRGGSLFDSIRSGDFTIGALAFAAHQEINGSDQWVTADQVVALEQKELPDAWLLEATVRRAPAKSGPCGFQARVRALVLKSLDGALVRPLWVENIDTRPWQLDDVFWFCRSSLGGSSADDVVGGPKVPNYYRPAQFITDTKLGGCFGALNQADGWKVMFWADVPGGSIHPDCHYGVNQLLQPKQRWTAGAMPYLWVYASRNSDAWKVLSRMESQASRALPSEAGK